MPRSILFLLIWSSIGISVSNQVLAQEVYVKDSLRVGVRAEPGNSSVPFSVVTTGMKLSILEREGDFIKVRLPSGTEGWIKGTYVSDEPPAILKLEQVQQKLQALESRLKQQEQRAKASDLNNKSLNTEIEQLKQANAELQVQLQNEIETNSSGGLSYLWKIILYICFAIAGFAVGATWYRKQTMRRLGGLRF